MKKHKSVFLVCLLLAAVTWLVFGQVLRHDFINCDDDFFVYDNPTVLAGLTAEGVVKTLTRSDETFYYPLTVLSFMTDAELYGIEPFGFHLTNLLFHTANVLLLFLLLYRMTGSLWCSAFAAALFAIHPQRAESVAWVTERKDVLSGFFFLLALHAYVGYVRRPFSLLCYGSVMLCMAAGLLAKPMIVTLPVIFLLLDGWPLQRFSKDTIRRVWLEKIPLFALSVLFGVITLLASTTGPESTLKLPSMAWRIGNAVVSYAVYLRQLVWPTELAMPIPVYELSGWSIAVSAIVLAGISAAVFRLRRKFPFLLTGWLWYGVMLLPVCGILEYLGTARADRFTYLPQIGLGLMLTWGLAKLATTPRRRLMLSIGACSALVAFGAAAFVQAGYWKDSITLWNHTIACTSGNTIAHNNLGVALGETGRSAAAAEQFKEAIKIDDQDTDAWFNLGLVFAGNRQLAEARTCIERALDINPNYVKAYKALGGILIMQGELESGAAWTRKYLEHHPDDASALRNLAASEKSREDADE